MTAARRALPSSISDRRLPVQNRRDTPFENSGGDIMALNVLFVGGTGQISLPCVKLALKAGHKVSVFNRGQRHEKLPKGVTSIVGDMRDPKSYAQLGKQKWDVVAQFMVFT